MEVPDCERNWCGVMPATKRGKGSLRAHVREEPFRVLVGPTVWTPESIPAFLGLFHLAAATNMRRMIRGGAAVDDAPTGIHEIYTM